MIVIQCLLTGCAEHRNNEANSEESVGILFHYDRISILNMRIGCRFYISHKKIAVIVTTCAILCTYIGLKSISWFLLGVLTAFGAFCYLIRFAESSLG